MLVLIMAASIMQVIDATIANVALPHMQAALSSTPDTITWVLTSYIVAAAIATPVTGWLADRIGRRPLLLAAVGGFTLASMLCGVANSLPLMVFARLIQGLFGAFIAPLGQSLILDIHPREKHAQAMTVWGLGVMVAPVLGPVVGGWLTDSFNWRWVFFINVPLGLLTVFGLILLMPKIPHRARRFDTAGFVMLFLLLGGFQLMLDRGPQLDWFDSTEIILEASLAAAALWMFVIHTMTRRDTILPSLLFRDRNLAICTLLVLVIMGILLASSALLPPFLQRLMGHTAYSAGLVTAPRGLGLFLAMILAGRLVRVVDARLLILAGLVIVMVSLHIITRFSLEMGSEPIIVSGVLQGLGFGFVILPINLLAFTTLDPRHRTEAASLYNLARNIGGSIAISTLSAVMTRMQQTSHSELAAHVTAGKIPLALSPAMGQIAQGSGTIFALMDAEITRQAAMVAFIDGAYLMFWLVAAVMPLVLLLRSASGPPDPTLALGE